MLENSNPPVDKEWVHWVGKHGKERDAQEVRRIVRKGGGVYVTRYRARKLDLEYVGRVEKGGSAGQAQPYVARFDEWGRLLTARLREANGGVEVSLRWMALARPDRDLTVFVHMYDNSGKIVAQSDGYPVGYLLPLNTWEPEDIVEDVRYLALAPGFAKGVL